VTAPPHLALAQPDLEAHAIRLLSPLGGCHLWSYDSGVALGGLATVEALQVDVRATSKAKARQRAIAARQRLLALPWEPWAEGVVSLVEIVSGPAWQPDEDGAPRYVVRVSVTYRPRPLPA
jgi:hypothetical protein